MKLNIEKASQATSNMIYRLFLLNTFLAVCLVAGFSAEALAKDVSHVNTSLNVTLTMAVTAIVMSCFLSNTTLLHYPFRVWRKLVMAIPSRATNIVTMSPMNQWF
jgi:uncharacterized membrane protein (DUF485 family)